MKTLILSCNTGQGHNSAGKALMREFEKRGIDCEMLDALAFGSEFASDMVSKIHSSCALHAPSLYSVGYKAAEIIDDKALKHSPCYVMNASYSSNLYKYINEHGYDTIVMPHVFPTEALTRIKRKFSPKIKTYFVGTDYAYPPFLKDTDVDGYFIAHKDLTEEFVSNGIDKEKIIPFGIPVSEQFCIKADKEEARRKLELPRDGKIVLVMTGSMGFGTDSKFVASLLKNTSDETTIIVMGGNNEKMKSSLRNNFSSEKRLLVLDFTPLVSTYMDAGDILLTKPGGLSTTEAAVKEIPFVHSAPIPGWEESNVKFFKSKGMSLSGENADDLVTAVTYLLGNPWKCDKMLEAQRSLISKTAAKDICEFILQNEN